MPEIESMKTVCHLVNGDKSFAIDRLSLSSDGNSSVEQKFFKKFFQQNRRRSIFINTFQDEHNRENRHGIFRHRQTGITITDENRRQ